MNTDCSLATMLMLMALAPAFSSTTTALGLEPVVQLVGVLQREGVDVDDDRRAARLRDDAGVVGNLFLLGGDQQHFHRALRIGAAAGIENLVVQIDVLDVEGDVLLGFPVDRLVELARRSSRGSEIFFTMTALPESEAATSLVLNAFDSNTRRIASATAAPSMMAPSTMLSGGTGSVPNAATRKPLPDRLQLDRLDGARTDVESHDRSTPAEQTTRPLLVQTTARTRRARPVPFGCSCDAAKMALSCRKSRSAGCVRHG